MPDIELIKSQLVGTNLRHLLKDRDITKWRLAKDCGITYRTIINWQAGKTKPSDELALRAAEYLGILKKKDSEIIEIKKEVEELQKRLKLLMKSEKHG